MRETKQATIRIAAASDAQDIANLVNRAYRPAPHQQGWTHEIGLVTGERTNADQVRSLLGDKSAILLLLNGQQLLACVHIEGSDAGATIGMLATDPQAQGQGLGKRMLGAAEHHAATQLQAQVFRLTVLTSRPELLAFYQRRGYVLTGTSEPYPVAAGVGQPLVAGLLLLGLEKRGN